MNESSLCALCAATLASGASAAERGCFDPVQSAPACSGASTSVSITAAGDRGPPVMVEPPPLAVPAPGRSTCGCLWNIAALGKGTAARQRLRPPGLFRQSCLVQGPRAGREGSRRVGAKTIAIGSTVGPRKRRAWHGTRSAITNGETVKSGSKKSRGLPPAPHP